MLRSRKHQTAGKKNVLLGPAAKIQRKIDEDLQQLRESISLSTTEVQNLKNKLELKEKVILDFRLDKEKLEEKVLNIEIIIEKRCKEIEEEKINHEFTVKKMKVYIEKARQNELKSEQDRLKLSEQVGQLELISPKSSNTRTLKNFALIGQKSIDQRCERILSTMRNFAGSENLDSFLTSFVRYVAKSPNFSFRTDLTVEETFRAVIRFEMSDGFMKNFKAFCKQQIGSTLLASRKEVDRLRKKLAPEKYYSISSEKATRKGGDGKYVEYSTILVVCDDVRRALKHRLEQMDLIFDDGTRDEIVVSITADAGAGITKFCLIIENCSRPNSAHGLLIL